MIFKLLDTWWHAFLGRSDYETIIKTSAANIFDEEPQQGETTTIELSQAPSRTVSTSKTI